MFRTFRYFISTVCLICMSGQKSYALTLEEAISKALQSSPLLQKSESNAREAMWKKKETYSGFLPSLSANANYLIDKKYALTNIHMGSSSTETVVPQIIPNSQLAVTSSLPLFEGFSNVNRFHAASEIENAANNELLWNQFKTELDVTLAFYKTLASKTLKEVAEQNLAVLKDHLKDVKLFKQSGMATNYDVLRVEVQVSNAETDLLNAVDNTAINEQNLLELLGEDRLASNKEELTIVGSLPVLSEEIIRDVSNQNIYQRADIVALKNRVASLSYAEKSQNAYLTPRLSLFGQYQFYNNINNSLTNTDRYRSAYQVGFQLSWNLFDGLTSFSRSKQSTEQFIQAEKSYRLSELKAQKDFEIWKRKYNYYLNLYKARNNDIDKSKESVRLAREGRRVGARTNTELLDAESDLYKSQAGSINAQLGAIEALINLETSLGRKIHTLNNRG